MQPTRMSIGLIQNSPAGGYFRATLLRWYDANRRDLPWRNTGDPYRIWLSEIMLQQTRVAAVLDHYHRFLKRFPDVHALARAKEQSVLAAWSGLGYYRRARNLHACAKLVSAERQGQFPSTACQLEQLPGVGRYTAAAIASIAFGEPKAVVDGNVERVLRRVTANPELSHGETWNLAGKLLSPRRPGDFNQAMMELGATVCTPREPKCQACPVIKHCATRGALPRGEKQVRNTRSVALGWRYCDDCLWLVQRPRTLSLMPGMWELPEIELNGQAVLARLKHSILDTDYAVSVFAVDETHGKGRWVRQSRLPAIALTGLTRKILLHFRLI
jgi:A/G-specific adenine glycosylase